MPGGLHASRFAIDTWSRGSSLIHRVGAGWKLTACVLVLIAISAVASLPWIAALGGIAVVLALAARLPLMGYAARASLVLPFTAVFALVALWQGHAARAGLLTVRAIASALWAVLLVGTTPMEKILGALRLVGMPLLLLETIHFQWRYLSVILGQAGRMRTAAAARGASGTFRAAAGSVAVLFASSYARAQRIHRAMLARGAEGAFR